MLTLDLPWPPSVNHYKDVGRIVRTKNGKFYQKRINSRETTNYYYQVYMISKQRALSGGCLEALGDAIALRVEVYLYPPDKRRRDIDNVLKVLLDSLVHADIIFDDSQIHTLFVQKMNQESEGRINVRISIAETPSI